MFTYRQYMCKVANEPCSTHVTTPALALLPAWSHHIPFHHSDSAISQLLMHAKKWPALSKLMRIASFNTPPAHSVTEQSSLSHTAVTVSSDSFGTPLLATQLSVDTLPAHGSYAIPHNPVFQCINALGRIAARNVNLNGTSHGMIVSVIMTWLT